MRDTRRFATAILGLTLLAALTPARTFTQQATPRRQPGADITLYAPEQHDLYDGRFVLTAGRIYMVGGAQRRTGMESHGQ